METREREERRGRRFERPDGGDGLCCRSTLPALAAIFGANYGLMLPVSTPPNAIVYSSGLLPITRMLKAGAVFDIIGAVLCVVGVIAMANVLGLV
jgi:solute carrier family 13 (sodium-dependent dicarboxylate transporter), member 2/3/5